MARSIVAWMGGSTLITVTVFSAVVAMSAQPAAALARPASSTPTNRSTGGQLKHSAPGHADPVAFALGSGYASRADAARVRALQRQLVSAGYSPGPIDGLYGPRTEQAVVDFQAARGLRADGIAGPLTLAALRKPVVVLYPGTGYAGHASASVRVLQRRLATAGYSPGPIDGLYGLRTERAVSRFQSAHGLAVDGIAGPQTLGSLAVPAAGTPGGVSRPQPSSSTPQAPSSSTPQAPSSATKPSSSALGQRPSRQTNAVAPRRRPAGHPGGSSALGWWLPLVVGAGLLVLLGIRLLPRRRPGPVTVAASRWRNGQRPHGRGDGAGPPPKGRGGTAERQPAPPSARARPSAPAGHSSAAPMPASGSAGITALVEEHGNLATAEAAYRRAAERGDPVAASNLGVILEHRGDLAGAEAAYRRADERGDVNGAFNLAALLAQQGDLASAEDAYRRAASRGDADAAANLGILLEQRGDLTAAEAAYRHADEAGDAAAAVSLGLLLEHRGDRAGAVAAYTRADERGNAQGAFNLGGALAERGDLRGAAAAYRRAEERGDPAAASNLGVLLEQRGDTAGALSAYRRGETRGYAPAAFNLAALLQRRGDRIPALRAYARAQQLDDPVIAEMARVSAAELRKELRGAPATTPRGGGDTS